MFTVKVQCDMLIIVPVRMCCWKLHTSWVLGLRRSVTSVGSKVHFEAVHLTRSDRGIGEPDLIFKLHVELWTKTNGIESYDIITFLFGVSVVEDLLSKKKKKKLVHSQSASHQGTPG